MESSLASYVITQLPTSDLDQFIEGYVFRIIKLKEGSEVIKYMPCRHSNSIDFFIGDSYDTQDLKSGQLQPFVRCTIRGPRTHKKYIISIKGNFRSFSIKFTPAGLYNLLGIPMNNFCDEAVDALLVYPHIFHELTERLIECTDIQSCISITEYYLQKQFNSVKTYPSIVSHLAELIAGSETQISFKTLYKKLPLSSRQLERNFVKEIGITPKLFRGIVRFENMIKNKIKYSNRKWTEIAYEYNYFDQMHLIKDFHRFLDINPQNFSPEDFAF